MQTQATLQSEISFRGIGLHSGLWIEVRLKPAPANSGITFVRKDLDSLPEIPALAPYVTDTRMATTLGLGGVTIGTIEHLLAAFFGMGVHNAVVEVGGPEIPILDGSAAPFCEFILSAGIQRQSEPVRMARLIRSVEVRSGDKWAVAVPSDRFEICGSIEWDHPMIGRQEFSYLHGITPFEQIAGARTFGFIRDYEELKKRGLARGGSFDGAVVLDEATVLNPGGLRFKDEFVRHKVLDAVGDFALAGVLVQAQIRMHRAGHELHRQMIQEMMKHVVLVDPLESDSDSTYIPLSQVVSA